MKDGEGAREFRELPVPLALKDGAFNRRDRVEDEADALPDPPRLPSLLSRVRGGPEGPDHSLSVAGELAESSKSPTLLPSPPMDAEPDMRLREDELELMSLSFAFSFSSKPINIRDRASL